MWSELALVWTWREQPGRALAMGRLKFLVSGLALFALIVMTTVACSQPTSGELPVTSYVAPTVRLAQPLATETPSWYRPPVTTTEGASPLSADDRELAAQLYAQLQGFKYDDEFHRVGFGACCRFREWQLAVERLSERSDIKFLSQFGFVPSEMEALAFEYMNENFGGPYVTELEKTIEAGLGDNPQVKIGQGVAARTDSACKTLAVWRKWVEATISNNHGLAVAIIQSNDCPRVYQGTVVTGPLETGDFTMQGQIFKQKLGELPDGTRLWFGEGHIVW